MRKPCVIGIGCDDHGDQIAGLLVVRAVAAVAQGVVAPHESSGGPAQLIAAWRDAPRAIVVEAMPGDVPGEVRYCDPLSRARVSRCSSTQLSQRLREALASGPLPPRMTVITIAAQQFVSGAPVSPVVARAADLVAAEILTEFAMQPGTYRCAT